jgi:asparagine N-glycosylation enzyme membrane subunit Stt3
MHGEQIVPLAAASFIALGLPRRRVLVTLAAGLLCGVIAIAWVQAGRGLAFPFG